MPYHSTEMFAHFVYSPELSYDDLLAHEEELKGFVEMALTGNNGDFVHYEAMGDTLHAQCVLPEYSENVFHAICESLAPHMIGDVEGRLLFVSKELHLLHLYTLTGGIWREACLTLPPAGPLGEGLRKEAFAK